VVAWVSLPFSEMSSLVLAPYQVAENVECEIMQVVLEEARESYAAEIIHECASETLEQMDANVDRVEAWLAAWRADNP